MLDAQERPFMHADVLRAINVQINSEFGAWYQYLAMAAFCDREKFTGAAQWLRQQATEEYQHGMKLFDFVLARNGVVELTAIEQPAREFDSFGDVFESMLEQEERVTGQINDLYELCFKSKAFAEMTELQWFLTEQVEEEKTARLLVARFRLVGDDPGSLLDLDRELGTRAAGPGGRH
jgi:ferritin